jgi:RNA polymerase sigma-54 factor
MTGLTPQIELSMSPRVEMRVSPALIAFAEMLAMDSADIDGLLERELDENPALNCEQAHGCQTCNQAGASCPNCGLLGRHILHVVAADSCPSTLEAIPQAFDERQELLAEVRWATVRSEMRIADYLVGCLDQHGFLDQTVDDLAATLEVAPSRVEAVLTLIREVGPPGVAARNATESLQLQLDRLEPEPPAAPLARHIVAVHLRDLAQGRLSAIAESTRSCIDSVLEARELIRSLRPYPVFRGQHDESPDPSTVYVIPEVAIISDQDRPGQFKVEVLEARRMNLSVDPCFSTPPAGLSSEEMDKVRALAARAMTFIGQVRRRWVTLMRVAETVAAIQGAFLRHGASHLHPLTRAEVARRLGFHESTVCRATMGKRVLLPSGEVVSFDRFFGKNGAHQALLQAIVDGEDRPLSDSELCAEMARQGHEVARRTIVKYRHELQIPTAALRMLQSS